MEKISRGKRASEKQKLYLINYLENNIDLSNDKFITIADMKYREKKWQELTLALNALGGTYKDSVKWRKYWRDLRLHTFEKCRTIRKFSDSKALSALEERIIKLTTEKTNNDVSTSEFSTELQADTSLQNMGATSVMEQSIEIVSTDDECAESGIKVEETSYIEDSSYAFESVSCNQGKRKRRKQLENIQLDKLYELELRKLREMETSNDIKRQQLELIKKQTTATEEQTKAIKANTLAKEALIAKLQDIIFVKKA
uniref:Regulatory protein zeste n=2 Tax=Ceratitis capitata TaxID=7213 RepID=W8B4N4_CERCA